MAVVIDPMPTSAGARPVEQRRGRPRSAGADVAILEAALELATEVGVRTLSMDEIAVRAGVSKATIYRRWCSKEALVLDALRSAIGPLDDVDTGSLGTDLRAYLGELADRMSAGRSSDLMPHLIEVACHDASIRSSLDDWVRHRRRPLLAILQRGVDRGELPESTDLVLLLDALIGPFVYRRLLAGGALDERFVDGLLGIVLPNV